MKEELIKRLLELVERTGDKVVVTDPAGERPYVLMSLDQYERMVSGTKAPETRPAPTEPTPPPAPTPVSSFTPIAAVMPKVPPSAPAAMPKRPLPPPAKPAPRREIPLWVPPEPTVTAPAAQKARVSEPPAVSADSEPEGEEQFYLEPLE